MSNHSSDNNQQNHKNSKLNSHKHSTPGYREHSDAKHYSQNHADHHERGASPARHNTTELSATEQNYSSQPEPAQKIFIAFLLNLGFSIFEFIGGILTNSIAITSDAVHDLGDATSIGIAYFLERYSKKSPDSKYTYGYVRYSVIGSLLTTLILLAGSTLVICAAISRLVHPAPVNYDGMVLLAIFGVVINFAAAYYTHDGASLNQKSVNLHMLEDVLGWIVVLIGAIVMHFTNFTLIDPILSIAVAIFILVSALGNFREVVDLFLEKTPRGISIDELRQHIMQLKGIKDVHHIHVWSMDGYHNYATMHVVCAQPTPDTKATIRAELQAHGISHVTIEMEQPGEDCSAQSCEIKPAQPHAHRHHH